MGFMDKFLGKKGKEEEKKVAQKPSSGKKEVVFSPYKKSRYVLELNTIGGKYFKVYHFDKGKMDSSLHKIYEFMFTNEEMTNEVNFFKILAPIIPKEMKHCEFILKTSGAILSYDSVPKTFLGNTRKLYKSQVLPQFDLKNYKPFFKCYTGLKSDHYRTLLIPNSSYEMLEHISRRFKFRIDEVTALSDMVADCFSAKEQNVVYLFRDFTVCTICIVRNGLPVTEKSFVCKRSMEFVRNFSLAMGAYEKAYPGEKIDHYFLYEEDPQVKKFLEDIGIKVEKGPELG